MNAVSEWLKMEIRRDGKLWFQEYERGVPKAPIEAIGTSKKSGTKVTFKPDPEIFSMTDFSFEVLNNRLREISFLNAGLEVVLEDERGEGKKVTHKFEGGIREFVEALNKKKTPLHDTVIYLHSVEDGRRHRDRDAVERLVQRVDLSLHEQRLQSRRRHASDRPPHRAHPGHQSIRLSREAAERLEEPARRRRRPRGPDGDHFVKHPDPAFSSQTKDKLVSSEVKGIVESVVNEKLSQYLEEARKRASASSRRPCWPRVRREAARRAREMVQRKGVLDASTLARQARRLPEQRRVRERALHRRG